MSASEIDPESLGLEQVAEQWRLVRPAGKELIWRWGVPTIEAARGRAIECRPVFALTDGPTSLAHCAGRAATPHDRTAMALAAPDVWRCPVCGEEA